MAGAKGKLGKWYVSYSKIIDRVARFVFALVLFAGINSLTGYMKRLDNATVVLVLAIVAAFLPTPFLTLFGFMLLLAHLSALSLPLMGVVAALFLIMYAFYFHFTPRHTIMLLLVPVAFWLRIPAVIPIAYGLLGAPILAYPITFGCISYYLLSYIHQHAKTFDVKGVTSIVGKLTTMLRDLLTNREMWLYIFAFVITLWVVSILRRRNMNHAWKIATIAGALTDILLLSIGAAVLDVKLNIGTVLLAHLLAVAVGFVLEYLFFGVDYRHKESMTFEDDDYVYYVSAVPKIKGSEDDQKEVKRLTHESAVEEKPAKPQNKTNDKPVKNSGKQKSAKKKSSGKSNDSGKPNNNNKSKNNGKSKNKSKNSNKSGNKGSGQKSSKQRQSGDKAASSNNRKKPQSQPKKPNQKWQDGMTDELLMTQSLRRDLEKEL